ncbi:MAG TPA: hypothetical protein DCM86_10010 [Verrucomicrobiales bacterium]|nr:hypothetical protein [Verrucomicrobiales bacterium]
MTKFLTDLTIPWVDVLVGVLLVVGVFRGRKNGLSNELLDVIKWVLIVVAGGFLHKPLTRWATTYWTSLSPLGGYIISYLFIGSVIAMTFSSIKRAIGEKISDKDAFGIAEFYAGMVAGLVRFACVILACMSLVHARLYTPAEIQKSEKAQDDNFGSIRFFRLYRLQADVFQNSFSGRAVESFLDPILIPATPPGTSVQAPESQAHAREKRWNEILAH